MKVSIMNAHHIGVQLWLGSYGPVTVDGYVNEYRLLYCLFQYLEEEQYISAYSLACLECLMVTDLLQV